MYMFAKILVLYWLELLISSSTKSIKWLLLEYKYYEIIVLLMCSSEVDFSLKIYGRI